MLRALHGIRAVAASPSVSCHHKGMTERPNRSLSATMLLAYLKRLTSVRPIDASPPSSGQDLSVL
jgi:hypothetical protein